MMSFLVLQADGACQPGEASSAFPGLTVTHLLRFLRLAEEKDQGTAVLAFRDGIRSGGL